MSVFWAVIVPVILSKKVGMYVYVSYFERFPRYSYITVQEFGFGAQHCPSLPPYRAALDFCLWDWMKSEVYSTKVDTRDELLDILMKVIAGIKEHQDALRRATRHVFTLAEKYTDVDRGIFENVLH